MHSVRCCTVLICSLSTIAWAHEVAQGTDPTDDGGVVSHVVVPPSIHSTTEAHWPPGEPAREAHVHLELQVDATGKVVDVHVLESAGEAFDAEAVHAVRQYVFTPATDDGVPVRAFVTYTYAFHPLREPLGDGGVTAPAPMQTTVSTQRAWSTASAFSVRDRDFAHRPISTVQDILRITPGLVMVQHSGGGKANQYFLRGFDADHGTDVALSIDQVPINLVSHAHGQGYADTNFIIPEVVERVEVTKGTSFADQGDFATAGSVNLVSRQQFDHSSFGVGFGGSPGRGLPGLRLLAVASPKLESVHATFAAELGQENGPFEHPNTWNKYKLFNKLTVDLSPVSSLSLTHFGYGGDWKGSGQIAARAVEEGLIGRFGSLDPSEGGSTLRHQVALTYRLRPNDKSEFKALAFIGTYAFNLFSNFTQALVDPVNGDEIEQVDRRVFFGAKLSYRVNHQLGAARLSTTVGFDARTDSIFNQLWHTAQRARLEQKRGNDIVETLGGLYLSEDVTLTKWLRFNAGLRADGISYQVSDPLGAVGGGIGSAYQVSPKLNVVVTPLSSTAVQWSLFANYGHGFHSNDVRGAFASPQVTPLTRAIGAELGTRARFFDRFDFAATGWRLSLGNETVWSGDEGTTDVSDPTLRYGLEVETRFDVTPWLAADFDVTFTHSQFSTDGANGGGLALAPQQTWSGGLSARHELGPGTGRVGLRFYGLSDRPANDDGSLVAPGFTQFDVHLGYRYQWFDVALDVENLFNGQFRSAQFATTSRLANEPAVGSAVPAGFSCGSKGRLTASTDGTFAGCDDVNFTPAYPFTARLTATVSLD